MIKDVKLGFKLVKYGLNWKNTGICCIIFSVFGLFMELLPHSPELTGAFCGLMVGMLMQEIHSIAFFDLVQSSSLKQKLQSKIPVFVGAIILLVYNTLRCILRYLSTQLWGGVSGDLIVGTVVIVVYFLYSVAGMKMFGVSTVIFVILYMNVLIWGVWTKDSVRNISLGAEVLISYGLIILASIVAYLLLLAMYKKNYSKRIFAGAIAQAQKK